MGSERLFECETEFDHYPLSRKEYAVWMSLTIGLSFTWLNLLDLYNNDTLFFQKLTISVINNTSFADVIASYLRLILYLPFGLLAIVLTLVLRPAAMRYPALRARTAYFSGGLLGLWFVNVAFPGISIWCWPLNLAYWQ